jgi:hypothetical protein
MNVMNLMVVALAGWINQREEDVIDYLRDLRERLARLPRYYYRDAA